ncbi:hypothetical protein AURDEDRAFT_179322 [Auricularia subglabra TFB-10046 SS5]|nr:hypothetical protein AURDEDRAFT_179322 [Auricularia subglabra TFB-10046 SS5]
MSPVEPSTKRKLAFAVAATASTAGLWFLRPYAPSSKALFGTRGVSIVISESLSVSCAAGDDPEDALFVLHTTADNYSASYLPFDARAPRPLPPLEHTTSLPQHCLDSFLSRGAPCVDREARPPRFDVIWTWVNGTDKLHQDAALEVEAQYFPAKQRPNSKTPDELKRYRDHDELRHSMRSVLANFRQHAGSFHLLTADFALPDYGPDDFCPVDTSDWRVGQVPQYLDLEQDRWTDGDVALSVSHHAQFFANYTGTTFNSFAIESQIPHIQNMSEHIVYMNDDYFFNGPLKPGAFWTPALGTVIRLQSDLLVTPESKQKTPSKGEWLSLDHSNELISQRFGYRSRPYAIHEAKSASAPLLREMATMYGAALDQTAHNRFRATPAFDARDVHPFYFFSHFIVERWREAALWSWAVAKSHGTDADWLENAWLDVVGGAVRKNETVTVRATKRRTLDRENVVKLLGGEEMLGSTTYQFASADGYPYSGLGEKGTKQWPDLRLATGTAADETMHPHFACELSRTTCFAPAASQADFFKRIAFERPECGDCILSALVSKSGELGLEALLPEAGSAPAEEDQPQQIAMLPLAAKWQDADFALDAVLPAGADPRAWTLRLLHRYRFVLGDTPNRFVSLASQWQAKNTLAKLDADADKFSLLCINDDITRQAKDVDRLFRDWLEKRWGKPAAWEVKASHR